MYTEQQYSPSAIAGILIALVVAGIAGLLGQGYFLCLLTFTVAFVALGYAMPYSRK